MKDERQRSPFTKADLRSRYRDLVTRNLGLKLFSLVLGLVIFLAVRNEQEMITTVAVRLILREPENLINTGEVPQEVTVHLSGTSGRIRALDPELLGPIELDLTSLEKGVSLIRIREEQLAIPPELKVLAISPSALSLKLEPREKRMIAVRAPLQGAPSPGFVVKSIEVDPPQVEVEGPLRELRDFEFIRAAPTEIEGATKDLEATVMLEPPGLHSRLRETTRVKVKIAIAAEEIERTLRVAVRGAGDGELFTQVRLRGPRPILERLEETQLEATLSASARGDLRGPHAVKIDNLPKEVELLEPFPTVLLDGRSH